MSIDAPVFLTSVVLILGVCFYAIVWPDQADTFFQSIQAGIVDRFSWFYILAVAAFLVFVIALGVSRFGEIRLGPDDAKPTYSYASWFAMLFSAGMGIGLVFFGVAEPILHYSNPPSGPGETMESAREAMKISFFHWGVHAWGIYALVGMTIAYFSFRHELPLTIRSALYPILGERIYGPIGQAVDIFAVLGTLFGVATSLGLGVMQINAGLNYLFEVPVVIWVQLALITVITLMATASVVAGLDRGIKRLSEFNLLAALALLGFVLLAGPTLFLLKATVQNTGAYLSDIVHLTFNLYAYESSEWLGDWTLFYWGWWIAWSPFVGMFIARVSRGRTVREFISGVLLVPTVFTILWMTFFGNTAISLDMNQLAGAISQAAGEDVSVALFAMLHNMPWSGISALLGTLLVVTFFVTSSDSGSLVIDMITSGGQEEPPLWQRVFWALTEGVVAGALLLAGGLSSLRTASITSALPFTVVLLAMCYALYKGMRMESGRRLLPSHTVATIPSASIMKNWRHQLENIVRHYTKAEVQSFFRETVHPALETVEAELREQGHETELTANDNSVSLKVFHDAHTDFEYEVRQMEYESPRVAFPEMPSDRNRRYYYRAEVFALGAPLHYDIQGYSKDEVIADVVSNYEKYMHFLHLEWKR